MRQLPHTEYKDYRGVGVRLMEPMLDDLTADAAVGRDAPMIAGYHAFTPIVGTKENRTIIIYENLIKGVEARARQRFFQGPNAQFV